MLNRLRTLIRGQASAAAPGRDLKESAAGLLVEAALVDGHMDPVERREIEGALVRSFELSEAVAVGLVDEAESRAQSRPMIFTASAARSIATLITPPAFR